MCGSWAGSGECERNPGFMVCPRRPSFASVLASLPFGQLVSVLASLHFGKLVSVLDSMLLLHALAPAGSLAKGCGAEMSVL